MAGQNPDPFRLLGRSHTPKGVGCDSSLIKLTPRSGKREDAGDVSREFSLMVVGRFGNIPGSAGGQHPGKRINETSNRLSSILVLTFSHSPNRGFDAARQPIAVHSVRKPW
jgi:hypothetical protein